MLKKKQVITIVSIAVISFLIGTTFNTMTMATDGGNPFDRIWEAIYSLESRVEALEDQMEPLGEIPFNGMTMSYGFYDNYDVQGGEVFTRPITFYGNSSEPDYIWVAGFIGMFSPLRLKINVDTRKVVGEDAYTIALFPTNLQVGDEIIVYWGSPIGWTFTIIENQTISVVGKQVEAWKAYHGTGGMGYTMYYEKKTGVLLGGTSVYNLGEILISRSVYLVTTNAPL